MNLNNELPENQSDKTRNGVGTIASHLSREQWSAGEQRHMGALVEVLVNGIAETRAGDNYIVTAIGPDALVKIKKHGKPKAIFFETVGNIKVTHALIALPPSFGSWGLIIALGTILYVALFLKFWIWFMSGRGEIDPDQQKQDDDEQASNLRKKK